MTSAALIALTVGLLPMSPVQAPTPSSWTAIERLKPGTEIVITLRGSTATTRYVALVDSSGVDLLNVTMLPPRAGRSIVDTARDYPLFVRDARRGGVSVGSVRLSPAGVFVESQKVAELEQVLTRVPEAEVYEVRIDRTPNWTAGRRTAVRRPSEVFCWAVDRS